MRSRRLSLFARLAAASALATGCAASTPAGPAPPESTDASKDAAPSLTATAGFFEAPARDVTVNGAAVHIGATGRLFYNLRPADSDPADKPIFFLFNGFAAEIVRAYGTGPMTVVPGGDVVANASSLTRVANLVYLEPRQSGYSYDVADGSSPPGPITANCSPDIFNEYVDAADVLFSALDFLAAHPELHGPVYWMGESYAGVRITWILTYLRGRWDLVPYTDPTLAAKIGAVTHAGSLYAGQVFLEAWLGGGPEGQTIANECLDPTLTAAVAASVGQSCGTEGACGCATEFGRSLYNYTYTEAYETERETEASAAHIEPDRAAALLGLPLTSIPLLAEAERAKGWKCTPPDSTVPSETPLVTLLGALPTGQAYYVPFSPLYPGKSIVPTTPDWDSNDKEALAFVDNLHDVPALLTHGARDLVVPTVALAPALVSVLGASRVDTTSSAKLGVRYSDGERFIDLYDFASAGHMITMVEPAQFAADLLGWLKAR